MAKIMKPRTLLILAVLAIHPVLAGLCWLIENARHIRPNLGEALGMAVPLAIIILVALARGRIDNRLMSEAERQARVAARQKRQEGLPPGQS